MAQRRMAATRVMAQCSPSTLMALALPLFMISQLAVMEPMVRTPTELIRLQDYFYGATPCMERRRTAAARAMARSSPSTRMARALGSCTLSRQRPVLHLITVTDLHRWPD